MEGANAQAVKARIAGCIHAGKQPVVDMPTAQCALGISVKGATESARTVNAVIAVIAASTANAAKEMSPWLCRRNHL